MPFLFFDGDKMQEKEKYSKNETLRVALGQINCVVGDLKGNCAKMLECVERAKLSGADMVTFPELAVTGYPPEDLLLKPKFIEDNLRTVKDFSRSVHDIVVITGFVDMSGENIYNAAAVILDNEIKGIYHKILLPNYGVFDEKRYFKSGAGPIVFCCGNFVFGVSICEDIWHHKGPAKDQVAKGANIILNINASPYHAGKIKLREKIVAELAADTHVPVVYTNLVGGQDELVFDGRSIVADADGTIIAKAAAFKEDLLVVDIPLVSRKLKDRRELLSICGMELKTQKSIPLKTRKACELSPAAEVYEALKLGLHDYVVKNGFKKVVVGLSGGIDSSLVAVVAADAIGKENVVGVSMPSRYTSDVSMIDARELADNIPVKLLEVPIEKIYSAYLAELSELFRGLPDDITEENIQARIRGSILMALSNKFGWLVLTTGNKSEMSVGYATLYGDMAGGFAVIKDVPKTLVYKLSRYRNSISHIIPGRVLAKAPTAELRPEQKDQDTLPPYDILDRILEDYIEKDRSGEKIASSVFHRETVDKTLRMVDLSEYKRRQSPLGIKITPKSFGKDRRMPITNRYRG